LENGEKGMRMQLERKKARGGVCKGGYQNRRKEKRVLGGVANYCEV